MTATTPGYRTRSTVPWLFALAGLLTVLSPLIFLGLLVADGFVVALLALVADLVAALVAATAATVVAARRGVRRVRTVVSGHPDGRAGRLAEHHAARWQIARERFRGLQGEYAAFEADPRAVAARPALCDVSVPSTARFVDAYADAEYLHTDTEPAGPRREEFAVAVDRAVAAWHDAVRVADALASAPSSAPPSRAFPSSAPPSSAGRSRSTPPRAVEPPRRTEDWTRAGRSEHSERSEHPERSEYGEAAAALRRAGARGVEDLRRRMRA